MNIKKLVNNFSFFFFALLLIGTTVSSCKVKEGCDVEQGLKAPVDKQGNLSTKRGNSNLFDKKRVAKSKKRKSKG